MLAEMGRVDTIDGPVLRVGEAAYKAVLVGGMTTIRSSTLDLLERFAEAGGSVIVAGDPPAYVDAVSSGRAQELASQALRIAFEEEPVATACEKAVGRCAAVVDATSGEPLREIFCQVRQDSAETYVMTLNVDRDNWFRNAMVRIYTEGYVQEWDCATGERYIIPARRGNGFLEIAADFPPAGEHLYVVTAESEDGLREKPSYNATSATQLEGPFEYTLAEPNVCVLDFAAYRIEGKDWQPPKEILKVDQEVRRALGLELRGGEMLQPWFAARQDYKELEELSLRFHFGVDAIPEGQVEMVMEHPELFTITLNGCLLSAADRTGWWVDTCFERIPFPSNCLRKGQNVVELRTRFHQGVNLEAIYLLGQFGVRTDGSRSVLTKLPDRLAVGDITKQGLPFYSGPLTYKLPLPVRPADGTRLFIAVPRFQAAVAKVSSAGTPPQYIAWQPYEADVTEAAVDAATLELELVLTRRNTFGPLHQKPLLAPGYGPQNFLTEGEHFSENHMLLPSGLLAPPEFVVKR